MRLQHNAKLAVKAYGAAGASSRPTIKTDRYTNLSVLTFLFGAALLYSFLLIGRTSWELRRLGLGGRSIVLFSQCGLNLFANSNGKRYGLALAVYGQGELVSRIGLCDDADQFGTAGDFLAIYVGNDIVDCKTGGSGGRILSNLFNSSALG